MATLKFSGMEVITRSGKREKVSFDRILERLEFLASKGEHGLELTVDYFEVAKKTIEGLTNGISTVMLDQLSADISASRSHQHPDYNIFASRIAVNNLHKQISPDFLQSTLAQTESLAPEYINFVSIHATALQEMLDFTRDYSFDYFGFKTLERSYLNKVNGKLVERPQHYLMRVAIQIHGLCTTSERGLHIGGNPSLERIKETYELMSQGFFTHASPTLFNSGSKHPQLSSCFLLACDDNLIDIFKTITNIGMISKWAGGIGITLSDIRATGTPIKGTGGQSDGLVPLLKVIESTAMYVNQGGRRKGSVAIYVEPWHADIRAFLDIRRPSGDEKQRARNLFTALWVNDLFMKRVATNSKWSLMCPHQCPNLTNTFGEEFEALYQGYEEKKMYVEQVDALTIWNAILTSQFETGTPYMLYKDTVNRKTNQANLGITRSSNLCAEITLYTNAEEIAVCNLASICLPKYLVNGKYDFEFLQKVVRVTVRNLNNVIDLNYYPTPETKKSNLAHRPIGIGVQGLSDVYQSLGLEFESKEASELNKQIFENIYYSALSATVELAKEHGTYSSFANSPFSKGQVQWHLWNIEEKALTLDWKPLLTDLKKYGARNSMLTALMPTATTSQIMHNTESFEVPSSNLYVRQTLAGEYVIVNERLVAELIQLGIWGDEMYKEIIHDNGSIQLIANIPVKLKRIYKTAFEVRQSAVIQQSIDRGPFIDQSQSLNLNFAEPDFRKLSSAHFMGWEGGLKTGMYYLRSKVASDPIKFGLDADFIRKLREKRNGRVEPITAVSKVEPLVCSRDKNGECDSCGS
jgi:ribonucleoside-diphosphate reductase alpha chain